MRAQATLPAHGRRQVSTQLVWIQLGLLGLAGFLSPLAWAEPEDPILLGDFVDEPSNLDSLDPNFGFHMVALGDDRIVFVAHDPQQGTELWVTDGTVAGTRLLRDIAAGSNSSLPEQLTVLSDRVYFGADDGIFGRELWSTDGTPEGTRLARDGRPGRASLLPFGPQIAAGPDRVVFSTLGSVGPPELWQSDGTRAGTRKLAAGNLSPGNRIVDLRVGTSLVYFRLIQDGSSDGDLWVTNGTEGGTTRLVSNCDDCSLEQVDGDRLYFIRRTSVGREPWISDGTTVGTKALGDLCPGSCSSHPRDFFSWRGDMFFVASASDVLYEEQHLFQSDGTAEGTKIVIAGNLGGRGAVGHPVRLGDRLYFTSHVFLGQFGLWSSDASFSDVFQVVNLESNSAFSMAASEALLFLSYRSASTQKAEFWRSDGTEVGTYRLRRFDPAPGSTLLSTGATHLTPLGDRIVFRAHTSGAGWEPWVSGGDDVSTFALGDLDADPNDLSSLGAPTGYGNRAVFWAPLDDETRLVTTDGTVAGTEVMEPLPSSGGELVEFGGDLIFGNPSGLWRTDGTATGTVQISTDLEGAFEFTSLGDALVFRGNSDYYDQEPWRTDGTAGGTAMIADVVPGYNMQAFGCCANTSRPRQLTPTGDVVFFVGESAEDYEDTELWRTDGTEEGTVRVIDACPGLCDSDPANLTPVGDSFFFSAFDGSQRTMWRHPLGGTAESLGPAHGTDVSAAAPLGQRLAYFGAVSGSAGHHLFLADASGQVSRVRDLATDGFPTYVHDAVSYGGEVVFLAANEAYGYEPWVTDGTAGGTRLLADLWPGPAGSDPGRPQRVGDVLVFRANGGSGHEPWAYDGYGVRQLADVSAGPGSSFPTDFLRVGDRMIFEAWTRETGREMWSLPAPWAQPRDGRVLELVDGRFEVTVDWRNQHDGGAIGEGTARRYSNNTGFFWFFGPENVELGLKILDGRPLNGHFWLLYGGLSDVEYAIRIVDRETGIVKSYVNEPGQICGNADVGAFPDTADLAGTKAVGARAPTPATAESDLKAGDLMLQGGRFRVGVDWRNQHDGGSRGTGDPIPATDESGYFSFFDPGNIELIVKILDARTFNGKFWVFYGALTDLEYTIRIEDTKTGEVKLYENPPGNICGGADTSAF